MQFLLGKFRFGTATFSFDDHVLAHKFKRTYGLCEVDGRGGGVWFEIRRNNTGSYSLSSSSSEEARGELEYVLGLIDESLDKLIRAQVDEKICSLHASSSVVLGSAVTCIGVSGSGKTTLALALAAAGDGFIGDEYAFLDLRTGMLGHEPHPIHVKVPCGKAVRENIEGVGLGMLSTWGVPAIAKSPTDMGIRLLPSHRLKMIVFPHFADSTSETSLVKVSLVSLPQLLLTSIVGGGGGVSLFKAMTRLAARNRMTFYEVRYSDAGEAAKAIVSQSYSKGSLCQERRHCERE